MRDAPRPGRAVCALSQPGRWSTQTAGSRARPSGADAHLATGADDADGDFAAVGDEEFFCYIFVSQYNTRRFLTCGERGKRLIYFLVISDPNSISRCE